jgi:hypothetical protein
VPSTCRSAGMFCRLTGGASPRSTRTEGLGAALLATRACKLCSLYWWYSVSSCVGATIQRCVRC